MTKKLQFLIIFILLLLISILTLTNPYLIIESVEESADLFFNKIFLSMFPFFILSDILISYNFPYYIGKLVGKFFNKIFKISKESSIVVILSMLSGHPGNAKYTKVLLDNGIISESEASKLIAFTYFPNPMFVIGSVGFLFLNNTRLGFYILLIIYLTNFIMGFLIRNKFNIKNSNYINRNNEILNFGRIMKKSIVNSFDTLILILGNITIFTILGNLIFEYIHLNEITQAITTSFIEITGGIKNISELIVSLNLKVSLIIFALVFSGFCIHSQIFSILSDYKINYKFIIKTRVISAIIVSILTYFILLLTV